MYYEMGGRGEEASCSQEVHFWKQLQTFMHMNSSDPNRVIYFLQEILSPSYLLSNGYIHIHVEGMGSRVWFN